jgi:D-glycero-D-manno-heptose 1,7-bisphosphate phosphatase
MSGKRYYYEVMNKAVFLDRDGTVNEEVGYLTDLSRLRLIAGAGAAIKRLNREGYKVILVTNQSGVARGYFPESLVHEAHERLTSLLHEEGAVLDGIYYCPHHPTAGNSKYTMACDCRKPGTGLIDEAAMDFDIDINRSFMIGDKWSDVELAQRAGVHAILVMSGFAPDDPGNKKPAHVMDPDYTASNISEAVDWIIHRELVKK